LYEDLTRPIHIHFYQDSLPVLSAYTKYLGDIELLALHIAQCSHKSHMELVHLTFTSATSCTNFKIKLFTAI